MGIRSTNLKPLSEIRPPNGLSIGIDFPATLSDGTEVWVTAVLERTVVVQRKSLEKKVVRKGLVLVAEGTITFVKTRTAQEYAFRNYFENREAARRGREKSTRNRSRAS